MQIPAPLTMRGHAVDTSPGAFGELQDSSDLIHDADVLRERLADTGYLFLRGFLNRDAVMAARLEICHRLATRGILDDREPLLEAIPRPGANVSVRAMNNTELTENNEALFRVLYTGRMVEFYRHLLKGPVLHFDFTWCRTIAPGIPATSPHCDVVYMGRGTSNLYTSWTPMGNAPLLEGPLCVIPGSHKIQSLRENYCQIDVDTVCSNRRRSDGTASPQSPSFGSLSNHPPRLRRALGMPFLTTNFKAGDLLIFSIFTIHCGLDNHGRRIRISTDSRYQRSDETVDNRWISVDGRPPIRHGEEARQELIC